MVVNFAGVKYGIACANSVIKQGITVRSDVTIGAGAVIPKDIRDESTVVGNPQHFI